MMMKSFAASLLFLAGIAIMSRADLQTDGVLIRDQNGKEHLVKRQIPPDCKIPVTNSAIWEGEFSDVEVPDDCKITLVKTAGKISPMTIAPGVETYGEQEVLMFMEAMKDKENNFLLVDSRGNEWYLYDTIPGAINLWFLPMMEPEKYPERLKAIFDRLNVRQNRDGSYDFSKAPTMLLFCNGAWCGQSPAAVKGLLKLGYPAEKLKWYRGGLHAWKSLSMTTTRSEED